MKSKKLFYVLIAFIWMITIFSFSNKNSTTSNNTSKKLIYNVVSLYENISGHNIDKDKVINKLNYPIRKLAHFSLYFLLGIIIYQLVNCFNVKHKFLITILICFLYATGDEVHQLFVAGRSSRVLDVFIDTSGSISSLIIMQLLNNFYNSLHRS